MCIQFIYEAKRLCTQSKCEGTCHMCTPFVCDTCADLMLSQVVKKQIVLSLYMNETLQHTATHCNTLQHTATHCNTRLSFHRNKALQHIATHCNSLQHTAPHCNTLQHTATHCNALQRTATHCKL